MQPIFLYKDLDLSFTPHPLTGDISPKYNADAVKRSIQHLVKTQMWDVPFDSTLHSHISDLLFELPDQLTAASIESKIRWIINRHERRAKIESIDVNVSDDESGYDVKIAYTITSLAIPEQLNLFLSRAR